MKNTFLLAAVAFTLGACQNIEGYFKNDKDSTTTTTAVDGTGPVRVARDYSISAANAVNDLMLDSNAVEQFIATKKLQGADADGLRDFYNRRNFQYAWFYSGGMTEQGRGFWGLQSSEGDEEKESRDKQKLRAAIDTLVFNDSLTVQAGDSNFINHELALTHAFVQYARNNNRIKPEIMGFLLPAKKMDALQMADSLLRDSATVPLRENKVFQSLKPYLAQYYNAAKTDNSGSSIANTTALRPDTATTDTAQKNLNTTAANKNKKKIGNSKDSTTTAMQKKPATAVVGDTTLLRSLSPRQNLELLLVNIYRSFWMPAADSAAKHVSVNIPSFMLYAYDSGRKVLEMPVVVGKEGTSTTFFAGDINQLVFSPYWNIPESIVEKEILPQVEKNSNYLQKKNMERVGQGRMRQRPGPDNPLGKVKFLFPNSFDIYLHDSPNKALFDKQYRAASHGCIRVGNAEALSGFILRGQQDWAPEKIKAAMNAKEEKPVQVTKPVPVVITYYTTWVDETGKLKTAKDVYGLDVKTAQQVFASANATAAR